MAAFLKMQMQFLVLCAHQHLSSVLYHTDAGGPSARLPSFPKGVLQPPQQPRLLSTVMPAKGRQESEDKFESRSVPKFAKLGCLERMPKTEILNLIWGHGSMGDSDKKSGKKKKKSWAVFQRPFCIPAVRDQRHPPPCRPPSECLEHTNTLPGSSGHGSFSRARLPRSP